MSLLLLFHGASTGEPEPEPDEDGHNYLARMAALRFVQQSVNRPKRKKREDEFWWWE